MSDLFISHGGAGAGRRSTVSNVEMRPFIQSGSWEQAQAQTQQPARHKPSPTASKLIDLLKSGSSWDERSRFSRNRKEKKKVRDRFAVNIPNRLIFHLIIVFFLVPLCLGMMLLIRALFFGLKEDEEHPLHKKLPHSHIRGSDTSDISNVDISVDSPSESGTTGRPFDLGDDRIEKGDIPVLSPSIDTTSEITEVGPLNGTYPIDGEEHISQDNIDAENEGVDNGHDMEESADRDTTFQSDSNSLNADVEESSDAAEDKLTHGTSNDAFEGQQPEDE